MITHALTDRLWNCISDEYSEMMHQCLSNNQLYSGPFCNKIENRIADLTQRKYCVFTNSGTSAILLSLIIHGVSPGDEVICPNVAYPACCNQIALLGAVPVFVDVDMHGHIDVDQIESKITNKTKGILPVGLYGENFDYYPLQKIAKKYNLFIVEDSAQSYDTEYDNIRAGKLGDTSILSFTRNKPAMTPFGGGALVTDNKEYAARARTIANHGKESRNTGISTLGINAQAKEDRAIAVNIALDHLASWNKKRQQIAEFYNNVCMQNGIEPRKKRINSTNNGHKFLFFVQDPDKEVARFAKFNIRADRYYTDSYEHTFFGKNKNPMPNSKKFTNHGLVVSTDPFLSDIEVEKVTDLLGDCAPMHNQT